MSADVTLSCLLLAAGSASRFGQPKQLALLHGKPLIVRSLEPLNTANIPTKVVLGAYAEQIKALLPKGTNTFDVPDWQQGMATSLATAIKRDMQNHSHLMICLADMPDIQAGHYQSLVELARQHADKIIVSQYDAGDEVGPPVIFPRWCFGALSKLSGDRGAKKLLRQWQTHWLALPMTAATLDIDTLKDLQAWQQKNASSHAEKNKGDNRQK